MVDVKPAQQPDTARRQRVPRIRGLWPALFAVLVAVACGSTAESPASQPSPDNRPPTSPTIEVDNGRTRHPSEAPAPSTAPPLVSDPELGPLIEQLLADPEQVSVVVSTGDGPPDIAWNEATIRPIASTFKTIVLAAYARGVADGSFDPDEVVPMSDVERWLLPGTDGGAHDEMVAAHADDDGIRLDELAAAMMAFSANTATDELAYRLGDPAIASAMEAIGLERLAPLGVPTTPTLSLLASPQYGSDTATRLETLAQLGPEKVRELGWAQVPTYLQGPDRHRAETLAALGELTTWEGQLLVAPALPWHASATTMHDLLERLLVHRDLGDTAAEIIDRHMSWPLHDPDLAARFERLAAKEGEVAGTLVVTALGQRRGQPEPTIAVIAVTDMDDPDAWSNALDTSSHLLLTLRLLEDPDFANQLAEQLHTQ